MVWIARLRTRRLEPEVMDNPDLDPRAHARALRGLARINRISATAEALWSPLDHLARQNGAHPLRVLDVACGGGDVAIRLARKARRRGHDLIVAGCDVSPRAVETARRRATRAEVQADFFTHDALDGSLPEGYDVILCSLFLHHLDEDAAKGLLRRMADAARQMVLVDDLQRGARSYALAFAGTRLLTRSPVVHVDGLRSVAAAFTMDEAAALARSAGLTDARIHSHWPYRYLLVWRRP